MTTEAEHAPWLAQPDGLALRWARTDVACAFVPGAPGETSGLHRARLGERHEVALGTAARLVWEALDEPRSLAALFDAIVQQQPARGATLELEAWAALPAPERLGLVRRLPQT